MRSPTLAVAATFLAAVSLASTGLAAPQNPDPWIELPGGRGVGEGRTIVLVSGDEEYRSEEALPQLAKILSRHHGFSCRVLFAIDPETGEIDVDNQNNIPGLEALEDAELMILFTRFRDLPDEQMKYIVDYVESGRPIIGLRTATHAFRIPREKTYARYGSGSREWDGGFGRQVLGEDWVNHHGRHGRESTRGVFAEGMEDHPILRGCEDIWGPTDVYGVNLPMREGVVPLVMGQSLDGMTPDSEPVDGPKNDPMMPVAWTTSYTGTEGKTARVFATTMGASQDFLSEGLRRLLVNATYWALGMESEIPSRANVDIVGVYEPTPFGFGDSKKGVKPSDLVSSGRGR